MGLFKSSTKQGVVGLDIRDQGLAIAHMVHVPDGQPRLLFCEYFPLGPGRSALTVLEEVVGRRNLKGANCVAVMSPGSYQVLQVEPPQVEAQEINTALKWKLREMIDYPIEQAIVDTYPSPQDGQRKPPYINVVVAEREQVNWRAEVIEQAGLKLRVMDSIELSLRNLLANIVQKPTGVALLSLSKDHGQIVLVRQEQVYLAREIETGFGGLTAEGVTDENSRLQYDSMLLEIQRSLDFYESSYALPGIKQLLIHPQLSELEGLKQYFLENLRDIDVETLQLGAAAVVDAPVPPELEMQCMHAVAAAMRKQV